MNRRFRTLWLCLVALSVWLCRAAPTRASSDDTGERPPRDVGLVVQPSAAALSAPPSDFQRIDHGWLVVEFPATVRARVEALLREADEARAQLSEDLGQAVLDHAFVRIGRTPQQMAELAPPDEPPPAYAAGEAYPSMHLILLALRAPDSQEAPDLAETLRHELAHVALAGALADHEVPLWFNEGVAIHESGELYLKRWSTLWNASLSRRLIALSELDRAFPSDKVEVSVAYAESADVVRFLMRDADRARFGSLIQRVRGGVSFDRALEDAYGTDARTLEYEWREEVGHRFGLIPALTGGGVLWALIAVLSVAAWVKRGQRARARLAQWAREEAEAQAAASTPSGMVTAGATPSAEPQSGAGAALRRPSVPVVEHEGRWYTLH
ncbi:MAG TPA: peptidase MA family metallohydrolase [Polyangiaceae bacterium]|nr:peptidase MA family metallohydrolase [Polyangiaceae bacterium]